MSEPHVLYDVADGVATVTLNRPERHNAMSPELIVRLARAWAAVRDDPAVSVALLVGAGDKSFCAGADLGRLIPLLTGARQADDDWDEELVANWGLLDDALLRDFDLYKPVVAAIGGNALAGGTEILMGTDFRIASPRATFGLTEVRIGIIPAGGSLVRLARQIPYTAAMKIILGGEPVDAAFAEQCGLVTEVVDHENLLVRATEVAQSIARCAPIALAKAKEAVVTTSGETLENGYRIESRLAREVLATEDAREGPRSFMEKRSPQWKGK